MIPLHKNAVRLFLLSILPTVQTVGGSMDEILELWDKFLDQVLDEIEDSERETEDITWGIMA